MKKYLAAAAVAVMVFAFSAFAASLTVDGGVLQAGVDNDLTCAEGVNLAWKTNNDPNGHWVGDVELSFVDAAGTLTGQCNGERAMLSIWDGEGFGNNQIAMFVTDPITAGTVIVDFKDGDLRAEDVELVQVLVGESSSDQSYNFPAP